MITRRTERLLAEAVAIEEEAAKEAGALGFMARAMVQATLPHRDPKTNEFERRNGNYTLTLLAPSKVGLPFGVIPRLLLAWMSTEAVRTQSRSLILGDSLSEFMRQLDMVPTGGRWGTITRLREQMRRLFSCNVSWNFDGKDETDLGGYRLVDRAHLWWTPQHPDQAGLWQSTIELGERFYNEVIGYPVPIDMRALKALKSSPLALDIYGWLTYRMSYLKNDTVIPWPLLVAQFGSGYGRERAFREAFGESLQKVLVVYPEAKVSAAPVGLALKPSPTHIAR